MTVLVTGGAGYIGSHMALRLGDAGEPAVVLDNLTTGFDWAIDHRATFIQGDYTPECCGRRMVLLAQFDGLDYPEAKLPDSTLIYGFVRVHGVAGR